MRFWVTVRDPRGASHHDVAMSTESFAKLSGGNPSAELVVRAAFRFLLDRESRESILSRFEISQIGRYFPEFEQKLPAYFLLR